MTTIYTVGHGLLPVEQVIANLTTHAIDTVVDVRSQPFSGRAPQFNKERLRDSLALADIGYAWMGHTLGGRPPDELRTTTGAPDYERMVKEPLTIAALDRVIAGSDEHRIALLCSEALPDGCHRTRMLEPELERRGAAVAHILPDGTLATRPTLFV